MCAQGGTIFGIWNSSTAILGTEEMRISVEKALDKIARNAEHEDFNAMIERLHVASLGGLLHKEDGIVLEGKSLTIFGPESGLRQTCSKLVTSIGFELFILKGTQIDGAPTPSPQVQPSQTPMTLAVPSCVRVSSRSRRESCGR